MRDVAPEGVRGRVQERRQALVRGGSSPPPRPDRPRRCRAEERDARGERAVRGGILTSRRRRRDAAQWARRGSRRERAESPARTEVRTSGCERASAFPDELLVRFPEQRARASSSSSSSLNEDARDDRLRARLRASFASSRWSPATSRARVGGSSARRPRRRCGVAEGGRRPRVQLPARERLREGARRPARLPERRLFARAFEMRCARISRPAPARPPRGRTAATPSTPLTPRRAPPSPPPPTPSPLPPKGDARVQEGRGGAPRAVQEPHPRRRQGPRRGAHRVCRVQGGGRAPPRRGRREPLAARMYAVLEERAAGVVAKPREAGRRGRSAGAPGAPLGTGSRPRRRSLAPPGPTRRAAPLARVQRGAPRPRGVRTGPGGARAPPRRGATLITPRAPLTAGVINRRTPPRSVPGAIRRTPSLAVLDRSTRRSTTRARPKRRGT